MNDPNIRRLGLRWILQGAFILLAFLFIVRQCSSWEEGTLISYSRFRQELKEENVLQITVSGERISGRFKRPVQKDTAIEDSNPGSKKESSRQTPLYDFITYVPSFGDETLFRLIEEKNVQVITRPSKEGSGSWTGLFFLMLLFGIGMMLLQRFRMQRSGVLSPVEQSQARLYDRRNRRTLFDDIAGMESAKREIQEIVEFLKDPQKFQRLGGKMPRGVLLVGPSGNGKDPAGPGGCRGGGRSIPEHLRVRLHGDVRWSGGLAGEEPVKDDEKDRPQHHFHRRDRFELEPGGARLRGRS